MVLDADGRPLGEARAEKLHKGVLELVLLEEAPVLGGLVCLRPAADPVPPTVPVPEKDARA